MTDDTSVKAVEQEALSDTQGEAQATEPTLTEEQRIEEARRASQLAELKKFALEHKPHMTMWHEHYDNTQFPVIDGPNGLVWVDRKARRKALRKATKTKKLF